MRRGWSEAVKYLTRGWVVVLMLFAATAYAQDPAGAIVIPGVPFTLKDVGFSVCLALLAIYFRRSLAWSEKFASLVPPIVGGAYGVLVGMYMEPSSVPDLVFRAVTMAACPFTVQAIAERIMPVTPAAVQAAAQTIADAPSHAVPPAAQAAAARVVDVIVQDAKTS